MRTYKQELEIIASDLLRQNADANEDNCKPDYSNRDFMNTIIIFQTALMDKMFDSQTNNNISIEDRLQMAERCGLELRRLIYTYTGLDTHDIENFL